MPPVTLQINLSPGDYRHAPLLLPHQLRFWGGLVQEILLVVDEAPPRGRFAEGWEKGRDVLQSFLKTLSGVRIVPVDYSPAAMASVAKRFFTGRSIPRKDCRGGPYYAYFFGLHAATNDLVLHCDSDMFFGGSAAGWLPEAVQILAQKEYVAFTAPLPGPPSPDGHFRQLEADPFTIGNTAGFRFGEMSTRTFLFDRSRFCTEAGPMQAIRPVLRQQLLALADGNPRFELPEKILSRHVAKHGLVRFDFAGPQPGCWTLHPPYRCRDFFEKLPELIARVERNDLPREQLGDHDINSSLVDWSEAKALMRKRRWWHRLGKRIFGSS
jgi:hypothetical protein